MSTAKKNGKMEDVQASLQALIAQGKKEGMIRDTDLNAVLSKMNLSPEKMEEIYDRFEAMNIQITTADLDALDDGLDGKVEAEIIALACSEVPEGHARWTLRLLAEQAVKLDIIDSISYVRVREILKKRNISLT